MDKKSMRSIKFGLAVFICYILECPTQLQTYPTDMH